MALNVHNHSAIQGSVWDRMDSPNRKNILERGNHDLRTLWIPVIKSLFFSDFQLHESKDFFPGNPVWVVFSATGDRPPIYWKVYWWIIINCLFKPRHLLADLLQLNLGVHVSHFSYITTFRNIRIKNLRIKISLLSCIILLIALCIFTLPPLKIINTSKTLDFPYMRR